LVRGGKVELGQRIRQQPEWTGEKGREKVEKSTPSSVTTIFSNDSKGPGARDQRRGLKSPTREGKETELDLYDKRLASAQAAKGNRCGTKRNT